jgi:hypothetical protein
LSHPGSKKMKRMPLDMGPGYSNHTYSNNIVNKYNISFKLQANFFTK